MSCHNMSWSNDKTLNFISAVKSRRSLWNIKDVFHRDKDSKSKGWAEIAEEFDVTSEEARNKFRNLRTYFNNERRLQLKRTVGNESPWFAYKQMSFISNKDAGEFEKDIECNWDSMDSTSKSDNQSNRHRQHDSSSPAPEKKRRFEEDESHGQYSRIKRATDSEKTSNSNQYRPDISRLLDIECVAGNIVLSGEKVHRLNTRQMEDESNTEQTIYHKSPAFGNYVNEKLQSYSKHVRNQVEFKISQILFEADIGNLDKPICSILSTVNQDSSDSVNSVLETKDIKSEPTDNVEEFEHTYT